MSRAGVHPDFLGTWLPALVILGVGAGLTFPTLSGAAVASVPGTGFALATALNSVARQVGAALGVAVLIAILGTPEVLDPLPAFRHGWGFAGGCFLVGAVLCTALVVRRTAQTPAASAGNGRAAGADLDELAGEHALPSLDESEGHYAHVEPQTTAEFLRGAEVFAGLPSTLLEELATLAQPVELRRGEWLFREGEEPDGVYVVRVGHVEVLKEDTGSPSRINSLTRGAVLGELALLSGTPRSASVRALRDSELLAIEREGFQALLGSSPQLALGLTRVLSGQLQASRGAPPERRARPVTIALRALSPGLPLLEVADELSWTMCHWGRVAVLYASQEDRGNGEARSDAVARFAPLVERCEEEHEQVLLLCGGGDAWEEFCLARADRVVAVVDAEGDAAAAADRDPEGSRRLAGADLLGLGVRAGTGALSAWVDLLDPPAVHAIAAETRAQDVARTGRRLTGRAVGVVLAGGGARAFAHLGALEVLLDAGLRVDRVGGVSMGSFIGAMLAAGREVPAIDACCYEEWVRRSPINDYTVPRHALIRGRKAEAMLERVFGHARVEELPLPYYCASVNLRGATLEIESRGPLMEAVGASMSLPLIAPPMRREERFLIDGSLLDNLPLEPMSQSGEGPVLAIDIKGGEARPRHRPAASADGSPPHPPRRRPPPKLPETMARIALLSSANTDEAARRHADLTLSIRVEGVGLLEFHQIDAAREAGRQAAHGALANGQPDWLTGLSPLGGDIASRRTVLRVRG